MFRSVYDMRNIFAKLYRVVFFILTVLVIALVGVGMFIFIVENQELLGIQVLIDDILIELVLFLFTGGRRLIHYFYLSRARRNKINSNKGETEENNEVQ